MIRFCLEKWNKNKSLLEDYFKGLTNERFEELTYKDLVKAVVTYIFNGSTPNRLDGGIWDIENITEIDNGDYQGTLLFLIPYDCYQPSEYEYLMTYVGYGSCSGCDTLQGIICDFVEYAYPDNFISANAVKDLMSLCKDIVTNTIRPYNTGWRENDKFDTVEYEDGDDK